MRRKLTPHERRMVSALSGVHDMTIRKWERGEGVKEASDLRIRRALASIDASPSEFPKAS